MASSRSRSSRGVRFGGSVRLLALFLLVSFFFSAMIEQAEGLKCYLCSDNDRAAKDEIATVGNSTLAKGRESDPSVSGSGSGVCKEGQAQWFQWTCPGSQKCEKFQNTSGKGLETYRGCENGSKGCHKRENGEQCFCDTDLCNDASLGNGASSMSSIGGIFIIILTTGAVLSATFGGF